MQFFCDSQRFRRKKTQKNQSSRIYYLTALFYSFILVAMQKSILKETRSQDDDSLFVYLQFLRAGSKYDFIGSS